MRAVALMLSVTLLGCFPHNHKARTYAQLGEGASILAGIGLEAVVNSGADCDQMRAPGVPVTDCHTKASIFGDAGVALILGGLIGFIATISTAEEDKPAPPNVVLKPADAPAEKPALTLPGQAPTPAAAPAGNAP